MAIGEFSEPPPYFQESFSYLLGEMNRPQASMKITPDRGEEGKVKMKGRPLTHKEEKAKIRAKGDKEEKETEERNGDKNAAPGDKESSSNTYVFCSNVPADCADRAVHEKRCHNQRLACH